MKHALRFLRPYWVTVIIAPTFKLIEAALELTLPLMMKRLIDLGVRAGDTTVITHMSILMLIVSVLGLLSAWVCQYTASVAAQSYGTSMRNSLFQKIQTLSISKVNQFGVASLTNRITNDTNQIQQGVALLLRLVVRAPFICIGSIIVIISLDPQLAIVVAVATPIFALVLWLIMSKTIPMFKQVQGKLDALVRVLRENLSGMRVIRAFAKQKKETDRFDEANQNHANLAQRVGIMSALANPMTMLVMNMAIVAIIWFGGVRVNNGAATTGTLVALMNYMVELVSTLVILADLVVLYTRVFASAQRVGEVFDAETEIVNGTVPLQINAPQSNSEKPIIQFSHVDFRFPDGAENALDDINFSVNRGETIGIIGGTGSGKTILVNLMARMYDINSGQISINDQDIRNLTLTSVRDFIAMVPQKSILISGTVASNLRWGKPDASEKEMWAALETAQASFIRDKEGLDTVVERGGLNFSGGQRQRLSIARALIRKPQVLILDDSASALDFATDAALRMAIRKDTKDTTVFIVSQRASAIMNADQILVLDDGRIVGQGTHLELMKTCPIYQETVQLQLQEAEEAL